ncbi:MAG: SdrD B-like domain-containing protein, partial [Methylovulum miyakonense]|uniref:SdrD B-like domain-containing protein n=1 Tax=Methylovulum miyakonense TaxID=645578 RepID=UPI003BB5CDDB
GFYSTASLGDYVWVDGDNNGLQDDGAASGLNGVTVELYNGAGALVGSTVTANDGGGNAGYYLFTGLVPGDYSVKFIKPDGYSFASQDQGGNDAADSDANASGVTVATTLVSGENDLGWDAGLVLNTASLGDYVWYDKDADGLQDAGEAGIGGVAVTLAGGGADGLLGTLADNTISTTTTGLDGSYLFDGLAPGTQYQVTFATPDGFNGISPRQQGLNPAIDSDGVLSDEITLAPGEFNQTVDAGFFRVGIDIEKWVHSQSTVENPGGGEGLTPGFWKNHSSYGPAPLTGWPETGFSPDDSYEAIFGVNVSGCNPTLFEALGMNGGGQSALLRHSAAALLNASDAYVDYAYSAAQVIAMTRAAFANGTFETTKNLFATQNELGADLTDLAATSTTVINGADMDADLPGSGPTLSAGDKAVFTYIVTNTGDTAIANVVVTDDRLANVTFVGGDADHDGLLDLNETWIYTAAETVAGTGEIANIGMVTGTSVVPGGSSVTDNDAAHYSVVNDAVLGDRIWLDSNGNGQQDDGATGISGLLVTLIGGGADGVINGIGDTSATTTTGTDGFYQFTALAPGVEYQVQFSKPTGSVFTGANIGNDATDSDADAATGKSQVLILGAGENNLTLDAGVVQAATARLGDRIWLDKNGNGQQDSGETGTSGLLVTLVGGGADGVINGVGDTTATTTTGANGVYSFTGLTPGMQYQVLFSKPGGSVFTKANIGNNASDSDANTSTGKSQVVTLGPGENNATLDAGYYNKCSVGDKVWDDMNHNNIQDTNERGIANIKVKLMDATGATVLATATTNGNGNYLFANLDPGTYVLQFDKANVMHYNYGAWYNMSGWKWAVKNTGGNDNIDSDVTGNAVSTTNVTKTDAFTLVSGQNDMSRDAGITPIVIDLNGDGVHTVARSASTGSFDWFGNGTAIQSGWLSSQDGFLAIDNNGNGKIDSISELFGGQNKGDGFAKLGGFDSNGDGLANLNDADFANLRIWKDANGNHQTDAGELVNLAEAGVVSLTVSFIELPFIDGQGNLHLERSNVTLADGSAADMTDVYFNVSADDATVAGFQVTNLGSLAGTDSLWMG